MKELLKTEEIIMKITCVICGQEVEAIKSTKKYCSHACETAARRIKYAEAKKRGLKANTVGMSERDCLICGKTFLPKSGAANQRTCCYDCMPEGK